MFNYKRRILSLVCLLYLFASAAIGARITEASSSIQENLVHTYSQNTWAWNSLAEGPDGEIYLTHKISSTEIALKKWNGSGWDSLTSVTASSTGDTGFSDSLDLVVDADGKVHLVFKHYIGSGVTSKRGVKYGVYNGTNWSFSEVEAYSHPQGGRNFYDPALTVDSNGHAHIVYKYVDTTYYAKYATNKSGSWDIKTIATGNSSIDEVHEPSVQVDGNDRIHLSYVKEDNQNDYFGNFYYTSKALEDDNFPTAQKVVDSVSEGKSYSFSPLAVSADGNAYFTYGFSNYDSNWNVIDSTAYLHSNESGSWVRETLYTDQVRDIYPVGVYLAGTTIYVLIDSWAADWSENYFFAMAEYGSGWITGNTTVKPSLVLDYTNELTYMVDSAGNFMLAMLHNELKKITTLQGTSEDFGLIQSTNKVITFDENSATGGTVPSPLSGSDGTSVTLPSNGDLVRAGYVFVGWNTAADGKGTVYEAGAALNIGTENLTLYAQWNLLGDGNGDGTVTSADALLVYQAISGKVTLTYIRKIALDMDTDGDIDASDASLIMKAAAGKK